VTLKQFGIESLVAATKPREGGRPKAIQLVVENHSEHLLRRVQRRIAEEQIDQHDVALYFYSPGTGGTGATIERLQVDEYGDIPSWPTDFANVPGSGSHPGTSQPGVLNRGTVA
jgi:hypothetical protein